jgi:hypothetical protein
VVDVRKERGIDTQALREPLPVPFVQPVRLWREQRRAAIVEALVRIVRATVAGSHGFGVVRRRTLRDDAQPAPTPAVMPKQRFELELRRRFVGVEPNADRQHAIEPASRLRSGEIDPEAHAHGDGAIEVRQPLQFVRHDHVAVGVVLQLIGRCR